MRSSTVLAIALTSVASPVFAAPASARSVQFSRDTDESGALSWQDVKDFGNGFVDGFTHTVQAVTPVIQAVRPFLNHESRDVPADASGAITPTFVHTVSEDESGALSWDDIKDGAKKVWDKVEPVVQTVAPIAEAAAPLFLRDEKGQLYARVDDESGALSWQDVKNDAKKVGDGVLHTVQEVTPAIEAAGNIAKVVRPFLEKKDLDSSAGTAPDESEALSWDEFKDGAEKVWNKVEPVVKTVAPIAEAAAPLLLRRDGQTGATQVSADESGALSWDDIKDGAKKVWDKVEPVVQTVAPVAEAAAPLFLRDEKGQLYARIDDESGALSWQDVKDDAKKVANGFDHVVQAITPPLQAAGNLAKAVSPFLQKKDLDASAASIDESGALSWEDIKDGAKKVWDKVEPVVQTVAPIAEAAAPLFLRDEKGQVYARVDDESGALSWQDIKDFGHKVVDGVTHTVQEVAPVVQAAGNIAKVVAPLVEHEARDIPEDESGALSWDDIKNGAEKVWNKVEPVVQTVAPIAEAAAPLFLRDESGLLYARIDDESEALSWQDIKTGAEKVWNKVEPVVQTVAPIAEAAAPLFLRDNTSAAVTKPGIHEKTQHPADDL